METLKNRKRLHDIKFPVFAISNQYKNIWEEDKVLYIETRYGIFVLDNKNIKGENLAQRRLRIKNSRLYNPRKVFHSISQIIKSNYRNFIDTDGDFFVYIKTETVPLRYYKIKEIKEVDNKCVAHFKDIDNPILIPCTLAYGIDYVGFLESKLGYILYEYSESEKPRTWRKI